MSDQIGFTIISQANFECEWCGKAIELLEDRGLSYGTRKLSRSGVLEQAANANMSSVPIIYHGVKLVGGYTELVAYLLDNAV